GSGLTSLYSDWIDSVSEPDKKTVTVKQKYPYASNIKALTWISMAIVAKEAVEGAGGLLKADKTGAEGGAGPYRLTNITDTGYTWERSTNYYKHLNPSPTFVEDGPYIDKIEYQVITDAAAVEAKLRSGELDMVGTLAGISTQLAWDKAKAADLSKAA